MIRYQEVCLTLAAAGLIAALVASGRARDEDRVWNPRESHSGLFRLREAGWKQSNYPSTGPTLTKWAGAAFAPQVRKAVFTPGTARGVYISLASPQLVTAVGLNCPFSSIQALGGTNTACSTAAASSGGCSVDFANGSAPTSCSTVTGQSYCSTNTPNGAGGKGGGPAVCSASGNSTGAGLNSCSTGAGGTCSTQNNTTQNGGMTSNQCSVGVAGATSQGQCSSGGLSGTAVRHGILFGFGRESRRRHPKQHLLG